MTHLANAAKTREIRWQQILNSFPATHFLFILDREGRYLDLQVPDPSRLWIPLAEHIGKTFDEVLPPELGEDRRYYFNKALRTGKMQEYTYRHPFVERCMTCIITPIKSGDEIWEVLMQVFDTAIAVIPATYILPPHEST